MCLLALGIISFRQMMDTSIQMKSVLWGYKGGYVTKEELEGMMRAHQKSPDGMKSDQRDKAAVLPIQDKTWLRYLDLSFHDC